MFSKYILLFKQKSGNIKRPAFIFKLDICIYIHESSNWRLASACKEFSIWKHV
jgi:hypothetical protein